MRFSTRVVGICLVSSRSDCFAFPGVGGLGMLTRGGAFVSRSVGHNRFEIPARGEASPSLAVSLHPTAALSRNRCRNRSGVLRTFAGAAARPDSRAHEKVQEGAHACVSRRTVVTATFREVRAPILAPYVSFHCGRRLSPARSRSLPSPPLPTSTAIPRPLFLSSSAADPAEAPSSMEDVRGVESESCDDLGGTDGGDKLTYPAPHPSQSFVATAMDGQRYEHDVVNGGARKIRAVVSDLDGTLLGPDKLVSAVTLEAVRRARAKGVIFVPASGRSKAGMFSAMGELGDELKKDGAPFVCMNGLTVYGQGDGDHGGIIHSTVMCPRLATKVVEFWRSHPLAAAAGVSLCGSEGDTVVVERLDDRTKKYINWREPMPKEVGDFDDAIMGGMELNRLYFWGPSRAAVDAFKVDLHHHLRDHPQELTRGVPEMIEVLPAGASKAVGLAALLAEIDVSPEEVIALGDEENDIEMLRAVGHGVAMGQASLGVRQAARYTAPSNALHGVAAALETFCGI